jgi:F1F0 ATPase subunit 2
MEIGSMDVTGFLLGFALGVISSGAFFAGLYMTIRVVGRAKSSAALLAASAFLRIGLFLTVGYFVSRTGFDSGLGYFAAFLLVRYAAISWGGSRLAGLRNA